MPPTTVISLQDRGSVLTLDGDAHRRRKALFLSLMTPDHARALGDVFEAEWRSRAAVWARMDEVVLMPQAREIITRAVCRWAGIHLTGAEAARRSAEFGAMVEGSGSAGPRNWRGLAVRTRTEQWARRLIEETRAGTLKPPADSALGRVAAHEEDGRPLPPAVAALELLNVIRPTTAVDRYVVFAAVALHRHPELRERLRSASDRLRRRGAPVLPPSPPAIGGKALKDFKWGGRRWDLDADGHLRHQRSPETWPDPALFRPERFLDAPPNAWNLIPQGGGDVRTTHRCPGETFTVELTKRAARLLACMEYDVPPQDLRIDLGRMLALPRSRFRMRNVRPV